MSYSEVRILHASAQLVIMLILESSLVLQIESRATTNRMRYAKGDILSTSLPLEQVFDIPTSESSAAGRLQAQQSENSYRINRDISVDSLKGSKLLDQEDKELLEKFYRETKASDPFLDDNLSLAHLWKKSQEQELQALTALLDTDRPADYLRGDKRGVKKLSGRPDDFYNIDPSYDSYLSDQLGVNEVDTNDEADHGWSIEPDEIFVFRDKEHGQQETVPSYPNDLDQYVPIVSKVSDSKQANYSPPLKLLTSYDPIGDSPGPPGSASGNNRGHLRGNKIVGATLYGQDEKSRPSISSKSAVDAVKMHDELLRRPPNDGKVRVRMYYHRAIHDDAKLWGTGPWKYWGHGWGLEFGFDPRTKGKKDFYQKGYTIERAFGRDFCKDKANCRHPDPDFFKDPQSVGKYSQQYHSQLRHKQPQQQRQPLRERNNREPLLMNAIQVDENLRPRDGVS